jgi:predicted phage baseplate assembly protein
MPIVSPQLDDLSYDRTVVELTRRIPVYAPEWTDHNDSDPGIALIQLFAYLAEQIGYRLNRIPDKNRIELLKLLGIRLKAAEAARSRIALLLSNAGTLVGYPLAAGAGVRAKAGSPPPSFETTEAIDVVPAQPLVLLSTKNPYLHDLLRTDTGRETPATLPATVPANDTEWLTVTWDGKAPKLKDMPLNPVLERGRAGQSFLWIGLEANLANNAGFAGVRVKLTIQLDDDEKPDLRADIHCEPIRASGDAPVPVDWLAYYDAVTGDVLPVPGRIEDDTAHLARSGTVRFMVPATIGPVPAAGWLDLRAAVNPNPIEVCRSLATGMGQKLTAFISSGTGMSAGNYGEVVTAGLTALSGTAALVTTPLAHPLDPALRDPTKVKAWIRVALPAPPADGTPRKIRMVTFNAAPVLQATTVTNELLGRGNGRAGQQFRLTRQNVLPGTLDLQVQESVTATDPLIEWQEKDSLDAAGAFDSVYTLDREAGVIQTGDGEHGRIVPLVPVTGDVVARRYRFGGGLSGNLPAGALGTLETGALGVAELVNFVPSQGGRDSETQEEAEYRARKLLSSRNRAVTADDFRWIASQAPGVNVARVEVVPLRRPLAGAVAVAPTGGTPTPLPPGLPAPRCAPPVPAGPMGLSPALAPGAVTVIVIPAAPGPEPIPTPSFLRAVCLHLNDHRLITTEVHVVPPQYCRICNLRVAVQARPGFTRSMLQQALEARFAVYYHSLTGGETGKGFPFGEQVHIADLMAQVYGLEGVARVESLSASFTRTKSNAAPREGDLVICPERAGEVERIALEPEETVSVDVSTFTLTTVA